MNSEDIEPDDIKAIPTFRAAYSDRTALLMARLSSRAYDSYDTDEKSLEEFKLAFSRLGLRECVELVDRAIGTAGFIAAGDDIIVVSFRGTQIDDRLDWYTDANIDWIVLQGGVRVHTGFFKAYWPIRKTLFETVETLIKNKPRPLYLTGHSLGGALATIATAEFANHDQAIVRDAVAACYTFGSPKVGDTSFDSYVKAPLYRITNGVDAIPTLPPCLLGYRQIGDSRYFGKLGAAPVRTSPNIFQKLQRTFWSVTALFKSGKLANLADHAIHIYIGKLYAWAQENIAETQKRRAATNDPDI